eukprot:PhM_4_TR3428/c0_g1_i1/m.198
MSDVNTVGYTPRPSVSPSPAPPTTTTIQHTSVGTETSADKEPRCPSTFERSSQTEGVVAPAPPPDRVDCGVNVSYDSPKEVVRLNRSVGVDVAHSLVMSGWENTQLASSTSSLQHQGNRSARPAPRPLRKQQQHTEESRAKDNHQHDASTVTAASSEWTVLSPHSVGTSSHRSVHKSKLPSPRRLPVDSDGASTTRSKTSHQQQRSSGAAPQLRAPRSLEESLAMVEPKSKATLGSLMAPIERRFFCETPVLRALRCPGLEARCKADETYEFLAALYRLKALRAVFTKWKFRARQRDIRRTYEKDMQLFLNRYENS